MLDGIGSDLYSTGAIRLDEFRLLPCNRGVPETSANIRGNVTVRPCYGMPFSFMESRMRKAS
jgi:hypothetical protein